MTTSGKNIAAMQFWAKKSYLLARAMHAENEWDKLVIDQQDRAASFSRGLRAQYWQLYLTPIEYSRDDTEYECSHYNIWNGVCPDCGLVSPGAIESDASLAREKEWFEHVHGVKKT